MEHGTTRPPASSTAPGAVPADVRPVLVLAVPALDVLGEEQFRGAGCVWCAAPLTVDASVDLGELDSAVGHWRPRACLACIAGKAYCSLLDHAPGCEDCARVSPPGRPGGCAIARGLYRLARQGRRWSETV